MLLVIARERRDQRKTVVEAWRREHQPSCTIIANDVDSLNVKTEKE